MKPRKLTLEIIVDQDSKDWHWIYDTHKSLDADTQNGISVRRIASDWLSEQQHELLMSAHNLLVEIERRHDER